MKTKILKNANYIGWIVIVMIFVFIYFSYFFIYIPNKESQIQQKGFRILKEYGSNMLDKHKYFENQFKNFGIYYSIRFLENSEIISKKDKNKIDTKKSRDIENVINALPPYIVTNTTKTACDSFYFQKDKAKKLLLVFCKKNIDTKLIDTLKIFYESNPKEKIDSILKTGYSNSVPIDKFMEGLKFDELFENIILFDNSKVWYSLYPGNLADITNPGALCDSAKYMQGGIYKKLNIRGEDKHTMILPLDFAGEKFYIAGFISDTDYQNKTRTINKQLLIFIVGILLLVFAGMPVLKIIFIDDLEHLKARDASGSAISLLFGIGLFILLIVAFSKKRFVDEMAHNRRIKMISELLYSNVTHDINSIKTLGNSIAHGVNSKYSSLADSVHNVFYSPVSFYQDKNLKCPFPLNEIILINENGIVKKGYTSTAFSDIVKVDLSERQYFKNIKNIENSWPTSEGVNFYVESIKSLNTGAVETAVSFYTTNFDSLPVLAITSEIPALYHQILPKDIEFVIINKTGKVLYHSKPEKNLHENFILECESDLKLINAINLGVADNIQINYNERKWLARIVPIKDTPLYHITLLNLNQADNKNARIFLFTFYFLIATLVFIMVGLIIMRWITHAQKGIQKNIWFLNWIILQPRKYLLYKRLSFVLLIIIAIQLSGFFIVVNPIAMLLYQFIFIVYTLFVSMVFLNRKQTESKKLMHHEFFAELNILMATVLLILFFLWKFDTGLIFHIPLAILIIITVFIYRFLKNYKSQKALHHHPDNIADLKIKRMYLAFLFLWLASISAVPVVVYYFSVKTHEENLWKQEQLKKVAQDNIDLQSVYNSHNEEWFKRIQGNGIDFLNISYPDVNEEIDFASVKVSAKENFANQVYNLLPDPITNWNNQPKLLTSDNYVSSRFENDTLFFKQGLKTGKISVNYSNHIWLFTPGNYVVLIFFIFIIIASSVWFLLKYLATVLLNLNQENLTISKITWSDIINNNDNKRILLNSFDGSCFLQKSKEFQDSQKSGLKVMKTIQASQIIASGFKIESLPTDSASTIWISGFNPVIYQIDEHEKLLSFLISLNQNWQARVIVDQPFDINLINEFYDDYIAASELKPEQLLQIFMLRKKWKIFFDDYLVFNGFLNQGKIENNETQRFEDSFNTDCKSVAKPQFANIWCNLTSYEKIVLFDLADDGLLNRKNKTMIQELINKRLIIPDPYPTFFSNEFRDFVRKSIKSDEVKLIESKLGLKGSWHNAKYLILLILIPLTAFIIISQGISIEKVFGIFAGGLAIITGIMRLFDSNIFKQS